ncbi:MAG: DMT family transporter [Rhizobiaceae bacterium]
MSRGTANLLLLVAGLVWGLGFIAQETAMEDIGPFTFMTLRFALAALAIVPFAYFEWRRVAASGNRQSLLTFRDWQAIFTVGLMFFAAMLFQQVGLLATTVTNAGILTGLYVVLTPLIAFFALGQNQPKLVWPAALLAFCGIWLLGGGGGGGGGGNSGLANLNWGDWLILLGAVFAALHVLAMGHAVTDLRRPALVACAQFAISGLFAAIGLGVVRLLDWSYEPAISTQTLIAATPEILYAALFAGALAFLLMAICQQYARPSDAAILMSSEALFAAAAGAILLGERLTIIGYFGALLLFSAIVLVSANAAKTKESTV